MEACSRCNTSSKESAFAVKDAIADRNSDFGRKASSRGGRMGSLVKSCFFARSIGFITLLSILSTRLA